MPFRVQDIRTAGKALVLSLCLLSACTSQTIQIPTLPSTDDAPHDDPALDAQNRLLSEAHRAFSQKRYPAAVLFFSRYIERSPESPRLGEARWWLGRTYEQTGDFAAAMAQYRILASGPESRQLDGLLYEEQALRRLDELRQRQADRTGQTRQLALRVPVGQLPLTGSLTGWLQEYIVRGATALILEPGSGDVSTRLTEEGLKSIVAEAHRAGLAIWVSLDVHQPWTVKLEPEWLAQIATRPKSGEAVVAGRPDLAHPGYQTALEETARMVSQSGCEGLFLPMRSVGGFSSEFSQQSFTAFTTSFGLALSPQNVLGDPSGDSRALENATYWRWVGWKSANYARLAARLRTVMRERNPTATVLIEVHQSTLSDPVQGLEQYGEDIAELAQRTGGSIVVRRESPGGEALIEKLGRQLGASERVWVEISPAASIVPSSTGGDPPTSPGVAAVRQWHTIIMAQ